MRKTTQLIRQAVIFVVGIIVVIIGLILIPLPGPGILITFLGLFILSREFTWAEKHADRLRDQVKAIFEKAKQRADNVSNSERTK